MSESYKPQSGMPNKAGQGAADLTEQAKSLGRELKSKASSLTDTVTRAAKDQAADLGTSAKDLATNATGKVTTAMNEQKAAGADYLGTVAQAVQRAAREFEGDVPQAADYIRQAAGQIETFADAVRQRNMSELVGEVRDFARRQPTLFFGGAVILGFAALRFFKSSAPGSEEGGAFRPNLADGSFSKPGESAFDQRRGY